jgi:hypothetical protein
MYNSAVPCGNPSTLDDSHDVLVFPSITLLGKELRHSRLQVILLPSMVQSVAFGWHVELEKTPVMVGENKFALERERRDATNMK